MANWDQWNDVWVGGLVIVVAAVIRLCAGVT